MNSKVINFYSGLTKGVNKKHGLYKLSKKRLYEQLTLQVETGCKNDIPFDFLNG